jgi:hypothetical protein
VELSKLATTPGSPTATYSRPPLGVVHYDVRDARQGQGGHDVSRRGVEHDERASVRGTVEAAGVEPEPVRPLAGDIERGFDREAIGVDHEDLRRVSDVRVDTVSLIVIEGPARSAGQWELDHDTRRCQVDDGGGAALAEWGAEIERVHLSARPVVGQPIRVRADPDAFEESLVGATENTHTRRPAIAREQQVVLVVDQDAGDARYVVKPTNVQLANAVDHVDPVRTCVRDVDPAPSAIDVCVVEAGSCARWQGHEARADERHPGATSFLHQA